MVYDVSWQYRQTSKSLYKCAACRLPYQGILHYVAATQLTKTCIRHVVETKMHSQLDVCINGSDRKCQGDEATG